MPLSKQKMMRAWCVAAIWCVILSFSAELHSIHRNCTIFKDGITHHEMNPLECNSVKLSDSFGQYDLTPGRVFATKGICFGGKERKKVCYEELGPRKSKWLAFLRQALNKSHYSDLKASALGELVKGTANDLSVVYLCGSKLERNSPIDDNHIDAFMIVENRGPYCVQYPIITPLGSSDDRVDEIMEKFAMKMELARKGPKGQTSLLSHVCRFLFDHENYIREVFEMMIRWRLDSCMPASGKASDCDFSELNLIVKRHHKYFDMIFKDVFEKGYFFDSVKQPNFPTRLNARHLVSALKVSASSKFGSFAVAEFISNRWFLPQYYADIATAENRAFFQVLEFMDREHDYLKHWTIRELMVETDGKKVADHLEKLSLEVMPENLGNFYCTINLVALASVKYQNFDIFQLATNLLARKMLQVKSKKAFDLFLSEESGKAEYQVSNLTAHLLRILANSAGISPFILSDLRSSILATSLRVLFEELCREYKRDPNRLLIPFY